MRNWSQEAIAAIHHENNPMNEYELEDLRERLRVRASLAGRRDNQHHYDDDNDKKHCYHHHHDHDDNNNTENRENGMDAAPPQPAAPMSEPTPATTTTTPATTTIKTTTTPKTTTRARFMELNAAPPPQVSSGAPNDDLEAGMASSVGSHRMIGKNDDNVQQHDNTNVHDDDNNTSGSQPPRIPRVRFASSSVSLPPPETAPPLSSSHTDVDKNSNNNKSYDNTTFNSVTWHQASQKVWAVGAGSLVLLTILIVFLFRTNGHDC